MEQFSTRRCAATPEELTGFIELLGRSLDFFHAYEPVASHLEALGHPALAQRLGRNLADLDKTIEIFQEMHAAADQAREKIQAHSERIHLESIKIMQHTAEFKKKVAETIGRQPPS